MPKLPKVTHAGGYGLTCPWDFWAEFIENYGRKAVHKNENGAQPAASALSLTVARRILMGPLCPCFVGLLLIWAPSAVVGQATDYGSKASSFATAEVTPVPELPATLSNDSLGSTHAQRREPKVSRGNQLMRQASQQLAAHRSINAKVRQRVELFGHTLIGDGEYHQWKSDKSLLLRTDLRIQLEDRMATFQQIVDGKFLWKYQDSPDIEDLGKFRQQLSRVDLDAVRNAVPDSVESAALKSLFKPGLDHGGLPRLMNQISTHFDFGPPRPSTLYDAAVWTVVGNWNPKSLESLSTGESEEGKPKPRFDYDKAIEKLPPYMPQTVTIVLGQADLFPHRIEYRRRTADAKSQNEIVITRRSKPILILDLFEVQIGVGIDPEKFVRRAGNLPVIDVTDKFLRENGLVRSTLSHRELHDTRQ